jgi:hypothetical protein
MAHSDYLSGSAAAVGPPYDQFSLRSCGQVRTIANLFFVFMKASLDRHEETAFTQNLMAAFRKLVKFIIHLDRSDPTP